VEAPDLAALRRALRGHRPEDETEARHLSRIAEFVDRHPDPFDRRIADGHLTGSAFVLDAAGLRVLLLYHRKLRRWLQPGGHADAGERTGESVALREAREETGLRGLTLHPAAPRPLDVDVHAIPARPGEPAHEHLDLRYLVLADEGVLTPARAEARIVKWFQWNELAPLDLDRGLRRGLDKARRYLP
jgi:8-oxo-dGTP pyrophosphatase MutT (NUDIX family)